MDQGLHELDATPSGYSARSDAQIDVLRRGFWELLQTDCLFQLHYNKPAAISKAEFNVNLPVLMADTDENAKQNGPIIAFVAASRITFITMEFFNLLDRNPEQAQLQVGVEGLCDQLKSTMEEWNIVSLFTSSPKAEGTEINITLADVLAREILRHPKRSIRYLVVW